MRDVVLGMMTTLNGRLDDPAEWVTGISDEQYREINRVYETFDTILLGSTTYAEMVAYWPAAENSDEGFADSNSEINRQMAHKMNSYRKFVFTRSTPADALEWTNAEPVVAPSDDDIVDFVRTLKAQPGGDIHLAGGATLARTFVRLGLIDEYHFFVFPAVSSGSSWFADVDDLSLELLSIIPYENGVVAMYYRNAKD